jgi:acetylornithine deacetylase
MVGYGTNAFAYPDIARACVVLGPGDIAQAHGDEEWVAVEQLERLAMIYRRWWGGA